MLRCVGLAQRQCRRLFVHPRGVCTAHGTRRSFGSQDANAVDEINSELEQLLGSFGGDPLSTPSPEANIDVGVAAHSPGGTEHVSRFEANGTTEIDRAKQQQQQHGGEEEEEKGEEGLPAVQMPRGAKLTSVSGQSHSRIRLIEDVNSAISLVEGANRVFGALGDYFSEAVYHRALEVCSIARVSESKFFCVRSGDVPCLFEFVSRVPSPCACAFAGRIADNAVSICERGDRSSTVPGAFGPW